MRILMYHEVTSGPPEELHAVSKEQFGAQLDWLRQNDYRVLSLADSLAGRAAGKAVVITFDDGYLDTFANAWPILAERGLPATVFLVAGRMGQTSAWRPGAMGQAPLMTWDQARQMAQAGFGIGSHTVSHPDLSKLEPQAVTVEVSSAKQKIEQNLAQPVDYLAYPFSGVNPMVRERVRQADYRAACSSPTGFVGAVNADRFDLRRITVLRSDSLDTLAAKVRGHWRLRLDWYRRVFGAWRRAKLAA